MKFYNSVGCALLNLLPGFSAFAKSSDFYNEIQDGMRPRCVATRSGFNAFLRWNENDHYWREVETRELKIPCRDWRTAIRVPGTWSTLGAEAKNIFGRPLSREEQTQLRQVRAGATVMRREDDVGEWLTAHPMTAYTESKNNFLTSQFGMSFSASVYKYLTEHEPGNAAFKQKYMQNFAMRGTGFSKVAEASENTVVLFALGYGLDSTIQEDTPGFLKENLQEIGFTGIPATVMNFQRTGRYEQNSALFQEQLHSALTSGKNVVLAGSSKGVPEMLAALAAEMEGHLDANRGQILEPGRGRVVAVLSMSGLVSGTFLGDRLDLLPHAERLADELAKTPATFGNNNLGSFLGTLSHIGKAETRSFMDPVWPRLPSDPTYVNFACVRTDYSLPVSSYAGGDTIVNTVRKLNLSPLANDGLIDYPGAEIPKSVAKNNFTIIMNSTHMVFDGDLDGIDLKAPQNRINLNRAALQTIFQLQTGE